MSTASGRDRLERRSVPVLLALRAVPRWVVFLLVLGCVSGGLLLTGPLAAALLGVVALFLGWLLMLAWPHLAQVPRFLRALTIVIVAAASIWRLVS